MTMYAIMSVIYFIAALLLGTKASEASVLWLAFGMLLIYSDFKEIKGKKK